MNVKRTRATGVKLEFPSEKGRVVLQARTYRELREILKEYRKYAGLTPSKRRSQ